MAHLLSEGRDHAKITGYEDAGHKREWRSLRMEAPEKSGASMEREGNPDRQRSGRSIAL
jgi:hypothetical protein